MVFIVLPTFIICILYIYIYIYIHIIFILFADDTNLIFKDKDANTLKLTMNNELKKIN